ncbi:hypothetical protein DL93DRAFT_2063311 [Clavulina sp. PMI_390]|nr:hypothetical protein DL93DRAFT_2063311 [Clavulina sp. PMI_390]
MAEFNLQEEVLALQDLDSYHLPSDPVDEAGPSQVRDLLDDAVGAVAESFDAIITPSVFDVYRSVLKHFDSPHPSVISKLLDSICSGLQAVVEAIKHDVEAGEQGNESPHRAPLEMFSFLLQWFSAAAERHTPTHGAELATASTKGKGKKGTKTSKQKAQVALDNWTWGEQIIPTLAVISRVLRDLPSHRVYTTTAERDTFINCLTRPAWRITENEGHMKVAEIKLGVYKIICVAVKTHGHTFSAQISMIQSLQYFEHLSEPMADILAVLQKEFDHTQLAEEVLRHVGNLEVAQKQFSGQDNKGPRSFSKFLSRISELAPRLILKQFSLLRVHLDSEAYPMRIALVEIVGVLVKEIAMENQEGEDEEGRTAQEGQERREKKISKLFDLLLERFCDVSSYVRVKVLQTISKLLELPVKLPKQRALTTPYIIDALSDKASSVRRYAISTLTNMILTHPFGAMYGGFLNQPEWETRYQQVREQLKRLEAKQMGPVPSENKAPEDAEGDGEEEDEEDEVEDVLVDEDEEQDEDEDSPKKKSSKETRAAKKKARASEAAPQAQELDAEDMANFTRLKLTKRYIADALEFIRQVEGSMDVVGQLLGSTSKAEVLESIDFFRVAHEYQMAGADAGIKRMLHLIWTKDTSGTTSEEDKELKGIRQKLIECYRALYFDPTDEEEADSRAQTNRIAKNMIDLTREASLAEITSLEELMRTLYEDGRVSGDVVDTLWQVYSADREIPRFQRRGAIIVLGMFALAKGEIVTDRVDTLLRIGLGPLGRTDLVLAQYTCVALQRLSGSVKKVKGSLEDKSIRLPMENVMFKRLRDTFEHPCKSKDWFGMAEQAINTIYLLGEQPDALCGDLIKSFALAVFSKKQSTPPAKTDTTDNEDVKEDSTEQPAAAEEGEKGGSDPFQLSQLVFTVGHVAFKHIVYLELVEREIKRRKEVLAKEKKQEQDLSKSTNAKEVDELEQVAGTAEDDTADRIAKFCDDEMLYGDRSLLAMFGPMIVHICGTPKKYKSPTLRRAATLALSKLMCVSTHFCEANLMLLFKIMETSRDPIIRSNCIIALGDVAVRFSHLVDENNNKLYDGLSDKDMTVKKNTLMVLTYLILGSMIKVKGQLGEMAKCLEDEDSRIADLAKLFFTELSSNKDNAIYNNLPDVISHLSIGDHALEEEAFQRTMKYIFTFVEKEKQADAIVEKLCQRFRLSTEPRQWRDIAYCLSLLPFKSERSVKKLIEGLPFYQDKLHEEAVYNRFNEILTKARSNKSSNKPDSELKEFEQILKDFKDRGEEEQALEESMQKKTAAARRKAAGRSQKTTERSALLCKVS